MPFTQFTPKSGASTPVPAQFFTELLPEIDHLGELKVTLYAFWRLNHMEGTFRYLKRDDFASDTTFMGGLAATARAAALLLEEGLERAVTRGTFLQVQAETHALYFLNTQKGRAAVAGLKTGKWQPKELPQAPIELSHERPNIFQLYETNIGPLTPMIAETLREAEDTYPASWITEAMQIAVENNVRRWRYIEAILESWKQEGKDDARTERSPEEDRREYFKKLAERLGR
jgi:DnaD/phage-associated family protein